MLIPLTLSAFVHMWNPTGFPDIFYDEGIYLRRAMHELTGHGPQESLYFFDHPYFGQIFLASIFKLINYPGSTHHLIGDVHSIEMLYFVPRVLMGLLAVFDTFLIYKISEKKYDRNVALLSSILFAIMPITWLLRRILLDSILMPFLLSSVLLAIYTRDITRNKTILILCSGICLGLAIFTKAPAFAFVPLVGFLIYSNNNRKLKTVGLWLLPIILLSMIWPVYALCIGQFNYWLKDVVWQTHRQNGGLVTIIKFFFEVDPVLFIIGVLGAVFTILKKDMMILLWIVPFIIFLSTTGFLQYFYWIPILPAFCISASRIVIYLIDLVSRNKNKKRLLRFIVFTGIGTFGLTCSTALIITNVSSQYEAAAFVVKYLRNNTIDNDLTIISNPVYSWIFKYVYGMDNVLSDYRDILFNPISTHNVLLIADEHFKENMAAGEALKKVYYNATTITTFKGGVLQFDLRKYPYTSMIANYEGSVVEIKTGGRP
jgi:Dolichyl-phosphate-mannose-protein mannosyltransferase